MIDADLGLHGVRPARGGTDVSADATGFAGRAGRAEKHRERHCCRLIQPEHPVIRAILAGDEEGFWRAEAAEREAAGVPPYGRMAGIILSGPDVAQVFDAANILARNTAALARVGAQVYGPAPAPIARIRGRHRVRLLVKAGKGVALQGAIAQWIAPLRLKGDLRLAVDIDPQSFY